jgi:uncharacterized protein DUF4331
VINSTRNLSKTGRRATRWPAHRLALGAAFFLGIAATVPAGASSHMDAPLITLDAAANTTDVYAFISQDAFGQKFLTTALAVFPFEHPGIGPNTFRFDDRVAYDIHVALDNDIGLGKADLTYRFRFNTAYANTGTILSFLGPVVPAGPGVFPANQNLRQTYTVTLIDSRGPARPTIPGLPPNITIPGLVTPPSVTVLGTGMVPPNNQGRVTNLYNQNNDGDQPAKPGALTSSDLDDYTKNTIFDLQRGHRVFAGQREDGFYADVQSIFDLEFSFGGPPLNTPTKPFDSQSGFNVHTIVLNIPLTQLGGAKIAGVYATTSRAVLAGSLGSADSADAATFLADPTTRIALNPGELFLKQVGRQGNPLFCEIFIAEVDKDRYNQTKPTQDAQLFAKYADNPEVARALKTTPIVLPGVPNVNALHAIYIPDLIRVDLTTQPAKLAGSPGFNRLGAFGGDVLQSTVQDPLKLGGLVPGGWPNGRRFGDDVVNIGFIALGIAGPFGSIDPNFNGNRVNHNDTTYNRVFPYAGTPHNGRNINRSTPNQF